MSKSPRLGPRNYPRSSEASKGWTSTTVEASKRSSSTPDPALNPGFIPLLLTLILCVVDTRGDLPLPSPHLLRSIHSRSYTSPHHFITISINTTTTLRPAPSLSPLSSSSA
jgi:hypothetical protein